MFRWLVYLTLFVCLVCVVIVYYFDSSGDGMFFEVDFLRKPKGIAQKDFNILLMDITPNSGDILDSHTIETPNPAKESNTTDSAKGDIAHIKLHAILNKNAMLNDTWYNKGDTITYADTRLILTYIGKDYVILRNEKSAKITKIYVFQQDNELFYNMQ